jgi:hypothetical protein
MRMHYLIRRIAGTFVLASLALGYWVSPYWYLFTAFVGLNLLQSSFTHWCFMEKLLEKLEVAPAHGQPAGREGERSDRVLSGARR